MTRKETLDAAAAIVTKDREADYGAPENSFTTIASFWDTYLKARKPGALQAHDVALMMSLLKTARLAENPAKTDSWIDLAGYSACGAECATS